MTEAQLTTVPSRAEVAFYRACLAQLSDRYLVLFSQSGVRRAPNSPPRDGEADFVIFDRDGGLVVVEVKGGGITHDPISGTWASINGRGERYEIKDPFRQALKEKHAIFDILRADRHWQSLGIRRLLTGHAVMFPDVANLGQLVNAGQPKSLIGGRLELASLEDWLVGIQHFWAENDHYWEPLGNDGLRVAEGAFCRPIDVQPLVAAQLEEQEERRIRLTEQQAQIFRYLGSRKRAVIEGGAGTGKTLLAKERARELAAAGHQTLLLCYNRPLADFLATDTAKNSNLWVMTFHQLCDEFVKRANREAGVDLLEEARASQPGGDHFEKVLPLALALAVEELGIQFDAIVVDEGQDFSEDYWLPIQLLLKSDSESYFYIFIDRNQGVYHRRGQVPIADEPFVLTVNCRNTEAIHDVAYRFYQGDPMEPPKIEGLPVQQIVRPSRAAQADAIAHRIVDLVSREGVRPDQIAVLVASSEKREFFALLSRHPLPRGGHWIDDALAKSGDVRFESVNRFKGLEADVVFLWLAEELDPERNREGMYVGVTRAKSLLVLVGTAGACQTLLDGYTPS